ncbi:hypothetical protein [Alteromonas sp. S167]|uniref:hypothetical protein n=1 Tax=Alteromonas sp. S167 TaxID=3117402 RepID=UPI002FE32F9A
MANLDTEIIESKAKKKALVQKVAIGTVALAVLSVGTYVFIDQLPDTEPVSEMAPLPAPSQKTKQQSKSKPTNKDRAELQKRLSEVKKQITPLIEQLEMVSEYEERAQFLAVRMEDAYYAYSKPDYDIADSILDEITSISAELKNKLRTAFEQTFNDAQQSFDEKNIGSALYHINEALRLHKTSNKAISLKFRIDAYELVQQALEEYRVGVVERSLEKQRKALQKALTLDPQHTDAREKLSRVIESIKERDFYQLISDADGAIKSVEFEKAKLLISEAKILYPNHPNLRTLRDRLAGLVKDKELRELTNKIKMFITLDEWDTVEILTNQGLMKFENDEFLNEARNHAEQIGNALSVIESYKANPSRLADDNIRQRALTAVADVNYLREFSAKLSEEIDALESLIVKQNTPVPLTITSDDNTYIRVLSVGIVGKVDEKIISLKPGKYQLEGSRDGYRSVIFDIVISPQTSNQSVYIACSERI